mmetsp:Transcript_99636/g.277442  ORF Transcript_99636/g.277442 Transcript_99636/m.277442 type:complete len:177 (-) Transcript_99636:131-661(-)
MGTSVLEYTGELPKDLSASRAVITHNAFKCRNASLQSQYVNYNAIHQMHPKPGDHDFAWRSHATNFARGGVYYAGKNYVRDPRSGVWFNAEKVHAPGCAKTKPSACHYMEHAFDRPGVGSEGPGTGMSFRSTLGGPFKRTFSEPNLRPPSLQGMRPRHTQRADCLLGATVTLRSPP